MGGVSTTPTQSAEDRRYLFCDNAMARRISTLIVLDAPSMGLEGPSPALPSLSAGSSALYIAFSEIDTPRRYARWGADPFRLRVYGVTLALRNLSTSTPKDSDALHQFTTTYRSSSIKNPIGVSRIRADTAPGFFLRVCSASASWIWRCNSVRRSISGFARGMTDLVERCANATRRRTSSPQTKRVLLGRPSISRSNYRI